MVFLSNRSVKSSNPLTEARWINNILLAFIAFGIVVALINLLNNRSLWLDEAMLSLNIVNKSLPELLKPLDRTQVAPIGFLIIEKIFVSIFGGHEFVLRMFPFLSYLLSIFLFYKIVLLISESKSWALFSTAALAQTLSLISYASEVKQYSSDVLITLMLILATLNVIRNPTKRSLIIYTTSGIASVWFSNVAIISLCSSTLALLISIQRDPRLKLVLLATALWILSFITYYFLFIHGHPAKATMTAYWTSHEGFISGIFFSKNFFADVFVKIKMFLSLIGFNKFWLPILVFVIVGVTSLVKKSFSISVLLICPVFIHLGLAYLKLYPFETRLVLYLAPGAVLFFSAGAYLLIEYVRRRWSDSFKYFLILPLLAFIYSIVRILPEEKEEIKKCMSYIESEIRPADELFIYREAIPSFQFYSKDFSKIFSHKNTVYGSLKATDFIKEFKHENGYSWLLFSHFSDGGQAGMIGAETKLVKALESKGYSSEIVSSVTGACVIKVGPPSTY